MKRRIVGSIIGEYNGVSYGLEDANEGRFYFSYAPGKFYYAADEDELKSKIDAWLADKQKFEQDYVVGCGGSKKIVKEPQTVVSTTEMTDDEWKAFVNELDDEYTYNDDVLHNTTECGERLMKFIDEANSDLGIEWEYGAVNDNDGVIISDSRTAEVKGDHDDLLDFDQTIIGIAIESESKDEFINRYKNYIRGFIYAADNEDEESDLGHY